MGGSVCPATYSNKTEVKTHFRANHTPQLDPTVVTGRLSDTETEEDLEAWLHCDFCTKSFPTNRAASYVGFVRQCSPEA